ncbi:MAG: hypothetical protein WC955_03600 [Elusimicrobiota bacterium]
MKRWQWYALGGLYVLMVLLIYLVIHNVRFYFGYGKELESKKQVWDAVEQYVTTAEKFPSSTVAPEARYRAAELLREKVKDYGLALYQYELIITSYPESKHAKLAVGQREYCYDFMPVVAGHFWAEGDSQTGGQNYRAEIVSVGKSKVAGRDVEVLQRKVFAGKQVVSNTREYYYFEGKSLVRHDTANPQTVMIQPLLLDTQWFARQMGQEVVFTVVARGLNITVRAGTFTKCAKIRQEYKSLPGSWRYDYYAPGVGRILTTTAAGKMPETRMTELLTYRVPKKVVRVIKPVKNKSGKSQTHVKKPVKKSVNKKK